MWIEFIDQGDIAYPSMVHDQGIWRDKLADYGAAFGTNTISTSERPPGIAIQPVSLTNATGSSATLCCTATGTATIYFQWQKAGVAIAGATNSSYPIASVAAGDAGSYSAKVWSHMGIKTSSSATLTVTTTAANTAPVLAAISERTVAQADTTDAFSVSVADVDLWSRVSASEIYRLAGKQAKVQQMLEEARCDAQTLEAFVHSALQPQERGPPAHRAVAQRGDGARRQRAQVRQQAARHRPAHQSARRVPSLERAA